MVDRKICEECGCYDTSENRHALTPYYEYCNMYVCKECAVRLGIEEDLGQEVLLCRYCKYTSKTKKQEVVEMDMVLHGNVVLCESCLDILGIKNEEGN